MLAIPRQVAAIGLLLAIFTSTGCVSSLKPLTDAKTSTPDLRLLGTWEFEDKDKMEKHTILVERKKDAPNVLEASAAKDGKREAGDLLLTKIGNDHYVSVGNKDKDGVTKYTIAKYHLADDGTLSIWGLETDFFAAAVENKELKGSIKRELFTDVTLDETAENLRRFLEKHGAKCFMKETAITVKRIKRGE